MEEMKNIEELTSTEDENKLNQKKNSVVLMFAIMGAMLTIFLIAGIFFIING